MECEQCRKCDKLFWVSEPGQTVCPTCDESDDEEIAQQRAVEGWFKFMNSLTKKEGK